MTRVKLLVSRLPHNPGDFLVKKWVEKALPKTSQQKLRELLQADASLEEFEAAASRIKATRVQFKEHEGTDEFTSDPLAQLRRELEALKLQKTLQEEKVAWQGRDEALALLRQELEELRTQKEVKTSIWCTLCKKSGHSSQDCPERLVCQFCGKPRHEARDCYFLKGMQTNWVSPSVSVHQPLLPTPRFQVESMYTTLQVNPSNERKPPFRRRARPIMCYRCGEYGHFQGKCSLPEGSPPCRFCPDTMDHYSKDCPKKKASTSGSAPSYHVNVISVDKGKQPAIHSSKREESSTLKYPGTQFSPVHSQWHLSEKEDPNGCDAPGKYGRFVSSKKVDPFFKNGQVEQVDLKEEQVTTKFDQFCKVQQVDLKEEQVTKKI
ncbi:hypothetical protein KP509_13G092000 [Ceratopteris richardii]|uniref:CCHC-type domain-containing protein n=1 Tax=Ceratopteris richardii TaxID=49495 RepID=A0A8T2TFT2_CERRI|nr:hypothetical protein KP509_13G092000 [Ceratopteris richardii]